jgi:hypothetical protein
MLQNQYNELNSKYSSLNQEVQNEEIWYASIRDEINHRLGFGEDAQKFVTPDDSSVKNLVSQITGGWSDTSNWNEYWIDVKSMYDWVVNNIKYSYDSPLPVMPVQLGGPLYWREDYWRYPSETISAKHGDCEDQAILLTSMIRCYGGSKYAVWTIELTGTSSSHLAVALPVLGGQLTILDPAGKFYTRNWFGGITSKDVRNAVNEWIQYWSSQIGNPKVNLIFSDAEYKSFSSTDEFINWVLNRFT